MIVRASNVFQQLPIEDLAKIIDKSIPSCYNYRNGKVLPPLDVALAWYKHTDVTLHPYSTESLRVEYNEEIKNATKTN